MVNKRRYRALSSIGKASDHRGLGWVDVCCSWPVQCPSDQDLCSTVGCYSCPPRTLSADAVPSWLSSGETSSVGVVPCHILLVVKKKRRKVLVSMSVFRCAVILTSSDSHWCFECKICYRKKLREVLVSQVPPRKPLYGGSCIVDSLVMVYVMTLNRWKYRGIFITSRTLVPPAAVTNGKVRLVLLGCYRLFHMMFDRRNTSNLVNGGGGIAHPKRCSL